METTAFRNFGSSCFVEAFPLFVHVLVEDCSLPYMPLQGILQSGEGIAAGNSSTEKLEEKPSSITFTACGAPLPPRLLPQGNGASPA